MCKRLLVIGLSAVLLSGCANFRNKTRDVWNVVTDRPTSQQTESKKRLNEPLQTQKQYFSDEQMVSGNRLSKKIRKQLIRARRRADKVGGSVQVVCPASATPEVLDDIEATGVIMIKNKTVDSGYEVIFSK